MAHAQSNQTMTPQKRTNSALGIAVTIAFCSGLLLAAMGGMAAYRHHHGTQATAAIQARAVADAAARVDTYDEAGAALLQESLVGLKATMPGLQEALILEGAMFVAHTDPALVNTRLDTKNLVHKTLYDDQRKLQDNVLRNAEERQKYPNLTSNPYDTVRMSSKDDSIYVAAPIAVGQNDVRGIVALRIAPSGFKAGGIAFQISLVGASLILLAWLMSRFSTGFSQTWVGLLFLAAMGWVVWYQLGIETREFQHDASQAAAQGFTTWNTILQRAGDLPQTRAAKSTAELVQAINLDNKGNLREWFSEASAAQISGDRVFQEGSSWVRHTPSLGVQPWWAWSGFMAITGLMLLYLAMFLIGWTRRIADAWAKHWYAYAYVAPAVIGAVVLVFGPFIYAIGLGFFVRVYNTYDFVWFKNYIEILSNFSVFESRNFYRTLGVTVMWTAINVSLHVSIGLGLAMILKDKSLRFTPVYRTLLIIPWALPNYITALIWKGMFNKEYGVVNEMLAVFGIEPVSWFTTFWGAFSANLVTNVWLGFPFMMVISLGALQSIPNDLYEAADVDGAGRWDKFRRITLPLLKPTLFPAVILGIIWTFNNFNIIYLVSAGAPDNKTDILITEAYRWAFEKERYGYASAYSMIIFVILFSYTAITNKLTNSTEGAYD